MARAGINGFPAVAGDMLLVGAGATEFFSIPQPELIAYELTAPPDHGSTNITTRSAATS
jgi:hypothetical protein